MFSKKQFTSDSRQMAHGSRDQDLSSTANRTIRPAYIINRYAAYYNMNHKRRGMALIFSHNKYDIDNIPSREGSAIDCKRLKETLDMFRFDVKIYQDFKYEEIKTVIQKVSTMDHEENDCILIAVLTHGEEGDYVYAYDCPYELSTIWSYFTAEKCPSLAGRPKIFFVQACRGNKLDNGVKVQKDGVGRYSIPTHADFLFAYATIPGFMAFRNTTQGSWFINELCKEMQENGFKYDLVTLLTFVTQKVAYEHESVSNLPEYNMRKQTPCVVSMLTRLLLFNVV
ncbi:caspase-like [Anopheles nili]|uniref:caspase-like n=1 Tax=Anopheles nili TaxID=185578 RepID=UPI00237C34A7|nr:caspase-like [Anopheles nili]XP_053673134.1 caspase-like [Anopheles nili]